ncbi:hypothetical protein ABZ754_19260 [Micromonospora purpureochromogenes]
MTCSAGSGAAERTARHHEASAPAVADYPSGGPGVRQRARDLPA